MRIDLAVINYPAVLIAGVAAFLLGGLWYTALFGKLWIRLHGYSDEQVKAMQKQRPPLVFFGGMLICYIVLAFTVAILVSALNLNGAREGLTLGMVLWLGPAAAIGMTGHLASPHPIGVYRIDSMFQLIVLVMMGMLLAAWR